MFLAPLSAFAGVWVDIFLFLSGYWLTLSMIKNPLSIRDFYRKRLLRVVIPCWIVLIWLFAADVWILWRHPSWQTLWQSMLLYFPTARIWEDPNSPLWYMTLLLFFYSVFPLVFSVRWTWISALLTTLLALLWTHYNPLDMESIWLHKLHTLSFPLGMWIAYVFSRKENLIRDWIELRDRLYIQKYYSLILLGIIVLAYVLIAHIEPTHIREILISYLHTDIRINLIEQCKSILLWWLIVIFFFWKPWKIRFLEICGIYSFEIYLIHWPLMSRYDIFFHTTPVWIATLLSVSTILVLSMLLQRVLRRIKFS